MACEILVLQPGIKPGPLAVRVWSSNHWTSREFSNLSDLETALGCLIVKKSDSADSPSIQSPALVLINCVTLGMSVSGTLCFHLLNVMPCYSTYFIGILCIWNELMCQFKVNSVQSLCSVWLYHPMDYSMPGFPVHHQLLELAQIHVHQVGDAIQPTHPLPSPSPPAFNWV